METRKENPFSDYGQLVSGERFIGRKSDLEVIERRVIATKGAGNLAIIGEPRIGKSSLVYKGLIENKGELASSNILPLMMNLGVYSHPDFFFNAMVANCVKEMEKQNRITPGLRRTAETLNSPDITQMERFGVIQDFFEEVRNSGLRVIIIIDEFDNAREIFKGNVTSFQMLRELSYRPEWRVTFVTTSRRSIRDIEIQSGGISTLDGIFHKSYLGMFVDEDIEEYYGKLNSVGISLNAAEKNRIMYYCGGHPYLLEMLGYELFDAKERSGSPDIDETVRNTSQTFIDYFDHVVSLLKEDDKLKTVLAVLDGPVDRFEKMSFEKILHYELFKPADEGRYTAFSKYFENYLSLVQREEDYWPLWSRTERFLRRIITSFLTNHYGSTWLQDMEREKPKLVEHLEKMRNRQEKQQKDFGGRAVENLIEIAYVGELFTIIMEYWTASLSTFFGKDKTYWNARRELLGRVRNYYAHNSEECIPDSEIYTAKSYCEEILRLADKEE